MKKGSCELVRTKRSMNWPGPMGDFVLNELSSNELDDSILQVPFLKERQSCQANFVKAIKAAECGEMRNYKQFLSKAVSFNPNAYLEPMFYLAQAELRTA